MNRLASGLSVFFAAMYLYACSDGGPCHTKGAVRRDGVCECPAGSHYLKDAAANIDRCFGEAVDGGSVVDGAVVVDAARATPEAGMDATLDAGRDGGAANIDAEVVVASASDAGAFEPSASEASVQGGNTLPQETCSVSGALRCALPGSAARQRCEAGQWSPAEACTAPEVCDPSDPSAPATCRALAEACKGSADKPACDGATMLFCGHDGFADRSASCESKLQCEVGLSRAACAPCLPGAFRCTGAMLEKCGADGQQYEPVLPACSSAALCNAQAGACTASACVAGSKTCKGDTLQTCNALLTGFDDQACGAGLCDGVGKQCDVCVPNTKTCVGSSVKTCNGEGQGFDTAACPSARPLCTGNGSCVECTQASECPAAGECSVAMCNAASGSCGTMIKASGTPCSVGICDGKGVCGPAPTCGDGVKNQASEECDDGNRIERDDCLNNCKAAICGDGLVNIFGTETALKEQCDPKDPGETAWTCSGCDKLTVYNACVMNGDCNAGEFCLGSNKRCTPSCTAGGKLGALSGCPMPPAPLVPYCNEALGVCVITGCRSSADCPAGQVCRDFSGDPNLPYQSGCLNAS
jgi:cysteine-rich repeat protein